INGVNVRTLHLVEKLARVCGKRFYIAALAFGINSVKSERRFARTAKPRDYRQGIARDFNRNVFQIVLASAAHRDAADSHGPSKPGLENCDQPQQNKGNLHWEAPETERTALLRILSSASGWVNSSPNSGKNSGFALITSVTCGFNDQRT